MFSPTASSANTSALIADLKLEAAEADQRQREPGQARDRQPRPPADALGQRSAAPSQPGTVLAPVRLPGDPLVGPDLRPGWRGL